MEKFVIQDNELRVNSTQEDHPGQKRVDKYIYVLLAVFLGDVGAHKFYAGRIRTGILYLVFCWTFVPWFFALYDIVQGCGKVKDTENRIWV
jgi:TM2 domain-containing membrane protein YozV